MTVVHDRGRLMVGHDQCRVRALRSQQEHVRALLARGQATAVSSGGKLAVFAAVFSFATAAFWAIMPTSPPVAEATTISVIACIDVLIDEYICD